MTISRKEHNDDIEPVKHLTAAKNNVKRYTSPRTSVVFVKALGVLCVSPYGENTEKYTLDDNRYDESDWD